MATFLEIELPREIALEAKGGPGFLTSVVMAQSGFEQRNINWSQARAKYDIGFVNKPTAYKDKLLSFFRNVFGRGYGFRMRDWSDYQIRGQQVGIGTGAAQGIQLVKSYNLAGTVYTRTIKKPIASTAVYDADGVLLGNTATVYYNGSPQLAGGWSLDSATGILTTSAPFAPLGVIITVDCDFDVPVRFDTDEIQISAHVPIPNSPNPLFSWPSIPVMEIRV